MSSPREAAIDLPHMRLAARVWGDESLPPLLALHGWLDNAGSFDALAPLICTHFHIVALDFPGHGRSAWRPAGTWYHYIDYVSDVIAVLEKLGWAKCSLLGHSLGGTVASVFAACRPSVVDKLFLIEALTDNRNRTNPELRKIFERHNGQQLLQGIVNIGAIRRRIACGHPPQPK